MTRKPNDKSDTECESPSLLIRPDGGELVAVPGPGTSPSCASELLASLATKGCTFAPGKKPKEAKG